MKGRDPFFKCAICGKYLPHLNDEYNNINFRFGDTEDTVLEIVEMWHKECDPTLDR